MSARDVDIRDRRYRRARTTKDRDYDESEIKDAINYLTRPTSVGLWRLEGKWHFEQGITAHMAAEIDAAARTDGFKVEKKVITAERHQVEKLKRRLNSFSFLFQLFIRLRDIDKNTETLEEYFDTDNIDELIFSIIDLKKVAAGYPEAFDYFEKNLYYEGIVTVLRDEPVKLKTGSIIVQTAPKDILNDKEFDEYELDRHRRLWKPKKTDIEVLSLDRESLKHVANFLKLTGKINDFQCYKIFSPEEDLLSPYVNLTKNMLAYIIPSSGVFRLFQKIISDYDNQNFSGAISAAGQVGEECLTQIFETLHRRPIKAHMTLGELKDDVAGLTKEAKVKKILSKDDVLSAVKAKTESSKDAQKTTKEVTRLMMTYINQEKKTLEKRLLKLEGADNDYSLFPPTIRLNLETLIRLRNTVSHKSTEPVGDFEALKSLYCALSIYVWWSNQKKEIDWTKSEKEIIKQFIEASRAY